jgi:hypothetical protein
MLGKFHLLGHLRAGAALRAVQLLQLLVRGVDEAGDQHAQLGRTPASTQAHRVA